MASGSKCAAVLIATALVALAPASASASAEKAGSYGDWPVYGRTSDNQRFSPLDQIDRRSVGRLTPAWIHQTGISGTFQTSPLVVDGVMYATTPMNHVIALDAATGVEMWRYRHVMATDRLCCGPANKGAALGHGRVYIATADGRLVALDQTTGAVDWDVPIVEADARPTKSIADLPAADPNSAAVVQGSSGLGANMAPLVFEDLVIVGVTGAGYGLHVGDRAGGAISTVIGFEGRFGRRGYLAAFNAATGTEVWRWYTTKSDGWEGDWRETTLDGAPLHRDIEAEKRRSDAYRDAWMVGGGSLWSTPALDRKTGLLFIGTGNPAPQMDDVSRPGDNLYTVSVAALDARTGVLRWHYQQVPHDLWGYDAASPPVLIDVEVSGQVVEAVAQASKTGWVYVNDRADGTLLFKSDAFVPQSRIFARPTPEGVTIAPGATGGASWSPASYDPASGLFYVAGIHMPSRYTVRKRDADGDRPALSYTTLEMVDGPRWGTLTAINTRSGGRIAWQERTDTILVGGVMATAGGLVFMGEGDGWFSAFNSGTGKRLWRFQCGAGVNAPPVSFAVDGRQYVAVAAGGHAMFGFPRGDAIIAFALPEQLE